MNSSELFEYVKKVSDYIEYSFYKNSSEIMEAIMKRGFENVFRILSSEELSKGLYKCSTNWMIDDSNTITKDVSIDMTGEMIFITETI